MRAARFLPPHQHQFALVCERQRSKQHRLDDGEEKRCGAQPKRQRHDGRHGKAGAPPSPY